MRDFGGEIQDKVVAIFGVSLLGLDSVASMFFFLGKSILHFFNRFVLLLMEEILHQLIGSLSQYLQVFIYPKWFRVSAINSSSKDGSFCTGFL